MLAGLTFTLAPAALTLAQSSGTPSPKPGVPAHLTLDALLRGQGSVEPEGSRPALLPDGTMTAVVRLRTPSLGAARAQDANVDTAAWRAQLRAEQTRFLARWTDQPSLRVLGRLELVLNAVILQMDPAMMPRLQADPDVLQVAADELFQLSLTETVPYIEASELRRAAGLDGKGVRVAVLDSGIDYTHAAFGGPGTREAYQAAIADKRDPAGSFPTAKVVGGFDFTGPDFPMGPISSDPDPIDINGHGTHVADIIGGALGVAPQAELFAVKVCAEVGGACAGAAILQGLEFAVDPNRDGDTADRVDVVNLSLGSEYGRLGNNDQIAAIEAASALGVITVAAAGNSGDRPFIVSSPSAAPSAISVAQTQVPGAVRQLAQVSGAGAALQSVPVAFARFAGTLSGAVEGVVQYGDGSGGGLDGCNTAAGETPFRARSLRGKIVLVDAGRCPVNDKVKNVESAGGTLAVIGMKAGAPPAVGTSDARSQIPAAVIDEASANLLRAGGGRVRLAPDQRQPLVKSMVATSARGPQLDSVDIKPEVGAPGGSVSAQVGTGNGTSGFGGTSGASPMVAGAAALLRQANPMMTPVEVKARLVENAEPGLLNQVPGDNAAVTRIGGGELRVARAQRAPAIVTEAASQQPKLGFGFVEIENNVVLEKTLVVRNVSAQPVTYRLAPTFRFEEDSISGAVGIGLRPESLTVAPGSSQLVQVQMRIDAARLGPNPLDAGERGSDPAALTRAEYDGDLEFRADDHTLRVPWHIVPRRAAQVSASRVLIAPDDEGADRIALRNAGQGVAQNDAFALLAVSEQLPVGQRELQQPRADLRAIGVRTAAVDSSVCSSGFALEFALNTWERQSLLLPVRLGLRFDIDGDGTDDFALANGRASQVGGAGANQMSIASDLRPQADPTMPAPLTARFFAEHATNTANTVLRACGEQIGLSAADRLVRRVRVTAEARGSSGPSDRVEGLVFVPGAEGLQTSVEDITAGGTGTLRVLLTEPLRGATAPLGVLLLTNGSRAEDRGGATAATEALILPLR